MANELEPAKPPKGLTEEEAEIARLMVHGLPNDEVILDTPVKAGWPLTLAQAAKFMGYRLKRARAQLDPNPDFRGYCRELLEARRESERARNMAVAVEIRDDVGDGTAATKTVRIKAASFIQGDDKPGVTVNINQQTNVANIQPGYVIRLPALPGTPTPSAPPLPPMIEGDVSP
jgi:hypothetical protein